MNEEHKHCWHHISRSDHTGGTTITKRCCHCNVIEQETIPPFRTQWEYKPEDHGPFAPENIVRWT